MIKCPNCAFDNLEGSAYCDSCGEALGAAANPGPAPASSTTAGRIIAGRYQIQRELGGGGQKQMYLAADLRLNRRPCALAELTPAARSPGEIAEGKAMFRREAETLATLSNFHIVQVYDYFDESNRCYLVEEYVGGQTLQQRIASRKRLAVSEIVEIAIQVLDALEYLHGLTPPLVHRDLKPDNIMLAPARGGPEVVKLIDFGIARHFQPQRGTVHGTPGYAAPEQYRGISEPRTDLYALAAILHFALSGRDPQEQAPFSFPPLQTLRPDLPGPLCVLVDQGLSNEIERRVAGAAEFRTRLLTASAGKAAVHHPPPHHATVTPHVAPPTPPVHAAPSAPVPVAAVSKIEWSPAKVTFRAVQRGEAVAPVTVTLRNTGRGTLEARVDTDRPGLVRVTPDHVTENQAHLRVALDSSAVMWGHRYRASIRVVLDHSGDRLAIPVVVEAADNQAVLARVRALSKKAVAAAGIVALFGEIALSSYGITVSATLHGGASARLHETADLLGTAIMLGLLLLMAAAKKRGRTLTVVLGLFAIAALHSRVAALFADYLLFPVIVVAFAVAAGLILRRLCIRFLARQGLGRWARLRAFLLLSAAPAALLLCANAWLIAIASAPPAGTTMNPPARMARAPATVAARPRKPASTARYRTAANPPRRAERTADAIEAELRRTLAARGFGGVGVSVDDDGSVYLSGSADDFGQKQNIEKAVRDVAGVRTVVSRLDVPRGWMGVKVQSAGGGALVQYVMPGSPADRSGIAVNDVIVGLDADPIGDHAGFDRAISAKAAGQTVTVRVRRAGGIVEVPVMLGKNPRAEG